MENNPYKIIEIGVISLETTTFLFSLLVFVIVVFFLNIWLFGPVIRNKQKLANKINSDKDLLENKVKSISETKNIIQDTKSNFWIEIKAKTANIVRDAESHYASEIQKKQAALIGEINLEQENFNNDLASSLKSSLSKIKKLEQDLIHKLN